MKPKKLIRIDETAWTWLKAESAKSRRSATQELAVILEGERARRSEPVTTPLDAETAPH